MINIQKVVTRNFILDIVARFQNLFGLNLKTYEIMIERAIKEIKEELKQKNIKLKWYRYEITQLTNGAVAVMLYGDKK